jgi:hypothetical protein
MNILIVTEEFTFDLGNCLRKGKLTVLCLWPITDIFRLKTRCAEVQLCFVRVTCYSYILWCSTCLELCMNSTLGLLRMTRLANGDQCRGHAAR